MPQAEVPHAPKTAGHREPVPCPSCGTVRLLAHNHGPADWARAVAARCRRCAMRAEWAEGFTRKPRRDSREPAFCRTCGAPLSQPGGGKTGYCRHHVPRVGLKRKPPRLCVDCGQPCARRAQRCWTCSVAARQPTAPNHEQAPALVPCPTCEQQMRRGADQCWRCRKQAPRGSRPVRHVAPRRPVPSAPPPPLVEGYVSEARCGTCGRPFGPDRVRGIFDERVCAACEHLAFSA